MLLSTKKWRRKRTTLDAKLAEAIARTIEEKYVEEYANFSRFDGGMFYSEATESAPVLDSAFDRRDGEMLTEEAGMLAGERIRSNVKSHKGPAARARENYVMPEAKAKPQALYSMLAPQPLEGEGDMPQGLEERIKHIADTYGEDLLFLLNQKGIKPSDWYRNALVDKRVFSKIKNDKNYHPDKLTALCLCVGAGLNLDEAKDLLQKAGYAFSNCDKRDIIFAFFIEEIQKNPDCEYDIYDVGLALCEYGYPPIVKEF